MRNKTIKTFYTLDMVPRLLTGSYSWSPNKPLFLMQHLAKLGLSHLLEVKPDFPPYNPEDFYLAHAPQYVNAFFAGKQPLCETNSIPWNADFANSVRYTNASLYQAIREACVNPEQVTFSPTSGFHHARPEEGMGFCTFSGQVIAAMKLYKELGLSGAYLDLDGHFGNSIEDAREDARGYTADPDFNKAIPYGMNINLLDRNHLYVANLEAKLAELRVRILAGQTHYVVWCHGADSHTGDDLGSGQCDTHYWLECSRVFFAWVKALDAERGKPLPVTISLFGGYRSDDYDTVLELHTADLTQCASILLEVGEPHHPNVRDRFAYEDYHPSK